MNKELNEEEMLQYYNDYYRQWHTNYHKRWRKLNPEKKAKSAKKWRDANKEYQQNYVMTPRQKEMVKANDKKFNKTEKRIAYMKTYNKKYRADHPNYLKDWRQG